MSAEQVFKQADGAGKVVSPANRHGLAEELGMPEREVHRVVSADAAAVDDQGRAAVFGKHERDYFLENVALVVPVALGACRRRNGLAVKAFGVYAIDTEKTDAPALDGVTQRVHQPPVLIVVETSLASGEHQHFGAAMAENKQFHVAADT